MFKSFRKRRTSQQHPCNSEVTEIETFGVLRQFPYAGVQESHMTKETAASGFITPFKDAPPASAWRIFAAHTE
ncbi:hypothetical protein L596_002318 [Steinernema carpocapsae]|uniref:Uncharacterized protein n=1 Tax=Steinernema carpocapsae TaxID=34508 RepID=A0A4U8UPD6_STECR|nr:hypothetical protein L596_002318 [Steinernema carpocapsae]